MPLSPITLAGLYPDMSPDKIQALSQATGFVPPPDAPEPAVPAAPPVGATAAPDGLIVKSIGPRPPDVTILPPQQPPSSPVEMQEPYVTTLGSRSMNQSSGTSVADSGVSPQAAAEAQSLFRQSQAAGNEALDYQTKAAEVRAPAREQAAQARLNIHKEALEGSSKAQAEYAPQVAAAKQDLRNAVNDAASGNFDPNRTWHEQSNLAVAMAAASQALGAFGAGITHGPNTAADIIRNAIDRDGRAQESDFAKKQWKVGLARDAFADAVQKYGSVPAAMEAQKAQKLAYVDSLLATQEAKANTFEQAQAIATTRKSLQEEQKTSLIATEKAIHPSVTRTSSGSTSSTIAEHERAQPSGQTLQGQVQDLSSRLEKAGIPEARQQIQHTVKNWRLAEMDPNKPIEGLGISQDVLDKLPGGLGRRFMTSEARENRKNLDQLFLGYRHELTGAGGSDSEMEAMKQAFYGSRTAAELRDTMRSWDDKIAAREQNIRAGYSPEANTLYNQRNPGFSSVPIKKK